MMKIIAQASVLLIFNAGLFLSSSYAGGIWDQDSLLSEETETRNDLNRLDAKRAIRKEHGRQRPVSGIVNGNDVNITRSATVKRASGRKIIHGYTEARDLTVNCNEKRRADCNVNVGSIRNPGGRTTVNNHTVVNDLKVNNTGRR